MNSNITRVSVSPFGSLFACGDISLLNRSSVSVAGSRKIDSTSSAWLRRILSQSGGRVIISGLALGADAVAHYFALKHSIPTIAVLPSGFNRIAPASHIKLAHQIVASGGLLLSAYSPSTRACRSNYIARNKIIAELGDVLIIPQCNYRSGTMHTVNFARSARKNIIVHDASYSGNQHILKSYNLAFAK